MLTKGYVQVYTGNGKGKTTCSIGQGIRAAGSNLNVLMVQFLKSSETGEMNIIKNISNFDFIRIGEPRDFTWNLSQEELDDLKLDINNSFEKLSSIFDSEKYDMIILDEVLGTIAGGFLTDDKVISFLKKKRDNVEVILTGRNASNKIIEYADLVTEMKEVKHYYEKGVNARKGIEF